MTAPPANSGTERLLQEALARAVRAPRGRMALVLHLSRLPAPAPRVHHQRIARAILQDCAQRHEGQIFTLRNGDMVLLCRGPGTRDFAPQAASADPAALPATLARLFRADAPDPDRLLSVWPLDRPHPELDAYIAERLAGSGGAAPVAEEAPAGTGLVDAVAALIAGTAITDLMQRQTAVVLSPGTAALEPLFREVTFSLSVLEARIASTGRATADPFLFRHLARRLDQRMMETVAERIESGAATEPAIHLNLTLPGILSAGFDRFAASCRKAGLRAGAEVSLLDVCADPALFARARARLQEAGILFVLDGVSHLGLLMTEPAALHPDLVKLEWSPRLADAPAPERAAVADVLRRLGPDRIVLQRAETERALAWGLQHGIRRFQGRHVDAMLGAARLASCAHATGCTLRQCMERASATSDVGRRFCRNTALLHAGTPGAEAITGILGRGPAAAPARAGAGAAQGVARSARRPGQAAPPSPVPAAGTQPALAGSKGGRSGTREMGP